MSNRLLPAQSFEPVAFVNCNELPVSLVDAATVEVPPSNAPLTPPATVRSGSLDSKLRNKGVASAAWAGAMPVAMRDPVASTRTRRLVALRSEDLVKNMGAFHCDLKCQTRGIGDNSLNARTHIY
jgi:hypothetical protein